MWALINNGVVDEITDINPEGRFHPSLQWVACDDSVRAGDVYENGEFSRPQPQEPASPTAEQLAVYVLARRDALLSLAAIRIAPLQDAVDLALDTPEDRLRLTAWKQYRVALNRVGQQANFPQEIDWPQVPA